MPSARLLRREIAREKQHGKADKQGMTTHALNLSPDFITPLRPAIGRVDPD
jgi:hypothetical protein